MDVMSVKMATLERMKHVLVSALALSLSLSLTHTNTHTHTHTHTRIDADECSIDTHTCDIETEVCHNLAGTYVCKCKQGLFKTDDGKCVFEEPTKPKKTKKKKKKKSKKGKDIKEEGDDSPRQYPWYYTLGPLTLLFVVQKYWKPNLVTSAGLILFLVVSYTMPFK